MPFQVPQFIQRELKIAGPLTFKQTLFVGGGALGVFLLYLILAQKSALLFILSSLAVVGGGLALAFVKVKGRPLPTVIANFFLFMFSSKTYLWKKKVFSPKVIKSRKPAPKKAKEKPSLEVSKKSQLGNLATRLETGTR